MSTARVPFTIAFSDAQMAQGIDVQQTADLRYALEAMGLHPPRTTLVLVGGAGGVDRQDLNRLLPLFVDCLVPLVLTENGSVIDGGTDAGGMRLMGQARARVGATFPLIGVAARETVVLPGHENPSQDAAPLEPNHSHFLFVPGTQWGDEVPWLSEAAGALAGRALSATVLVNGGEIARRDVEYSVQAGRPVLVIAGSGRTADRLAAAACDGARDDWEERIVASGLVQAVELSASPETIVGTLRDILRQPDHECRRRKG